MAKRNKSRTGIGFANPPQHARFKKGKSGNPNGRPKGSKNFSTQFLEELNAPIPFTENGQRSKTTKLGATIKQQVTKAAAGDLRAGEKVLDRAAAIEARQTENSPSAAEFTAGDREVLEAVFARMNKIMEKKE